LTAKSKRGVPTGAAPYRVVRNDIITENVKKTKALRYRGNLSREPKVPGDEG